jgi:MtrB/PioB family decaheme-associated outer membrane protein
VEGQLRIQDSLQQSFQATPDLDLPGVVQNAVNQSPLIDLKVTRERFGVDQRFDFNKHWSAHVRFRDEKRSGTRPFGSGSYERIPTVEGDTFRVLSTELPAPVDFRSDDLTLGTSYTTEHWGLNFDYTYSSFRNHIDTLTFDNPFAFVDQQANPGGGTNRMRFSQGLFDLEPDNQAHSFLVSGFVDLPHDSRWASAVGWSFWRQNDPFVPFTLNTAITASNLPAGITPTDIEALPERSLDGKVDTVSQDHILVGRISNSVAVNLHYRSYDFENMTDVIEWPGYAAYGESYWRINIEFLPTLPTPTPLPIESEPMSFFKQNAEAEVLWDITKQFHFRGFYELETWNRTNRQANRTNEHSVGAELDYRASRNLSASVDYRYSDRKPLVYDPGLLENSRLRMFDQAKRMRHEADALVNWRINSELAISASGSYLSEDYDENFFGLARYVQSFGSVDMLFNPTESSTIYASYSREYYNSLNQTISKTTIVTYDPANRWNRQTRDTLNSFTIGGTGYFAEDKLVADVHYALSLDNQHITTSNITAVRPYDALNAQANPFPDVETRFHELRADVSYQFTKNIGLGFRYIYEPYRLDDFSWNNLSPYPFEQLPEENDGRRFLFLDSRYTDHDANVIGVYLRLSFGGPPDE